MSNLPGENEHDNINQPYNTEPYGRITRKKNAEEEISGTIRADKNKAVGSTGSSTVTTSTLPETKEERIAASTREKGLKTLPPNFGTIKGDWQIINSTGNLFEMLYLDYRQHLSITPDIVKNNFNLINEFWKTQNDYWGGSNAKAKEALEEKFTKKNLEECLKRMAFAYEQLNTAQKIDDYYKRFREQQTKNGERALESSFKVIIDRVDPAQIKQVFKEGEDLKLHIEETAQIVKKAIDARQLKPYGTPSGNLLSEQLLSVSWMTDDVIKKTKEEEEFKKRHGREILDNVFAYSAEEIGQIMFDNEVKIKQQIASGLLKNSIDYFSPAKASQFLDIITKQKNDHLRYLQATYRLKPKLPYRFSAKKIASFPRELCEIILENAENFTAGKAQFKQGYIEVWLMETNFLAYQQLVNIRDKAQNADLAFLEFLYTFNPGLPYRFNNIQPVKTPLELWAEIDKNNQSWEAGKKELFDASIIAWLATIGHTGITTQWNKVKDQFASHPDIGLEYFLHLLNDKLEHAHPEVDISEIKYPAIQSGKIIQTNIIVTNQSRGALEAIVQLSKKIHGVSLSVENVLLNNAAGIKSKTITLTIDSTVLLKGVNYETSIIIRTFEQQNIEIPVSFKIIFPKNAFWLRTIIYALIGAAFFALIRLMLAYTYPNWLHNTFDAFLDWQTAVNNQYFFWLFGVTFFLFITGLFFSIVFLTKYMRKK